MLRRAATVAFALLASNLYAGSDRVETGGMAHLATPSKGPYRLPGTKQSEQIQWGAWCKAPGGAGLLFGGEDQAAEDGNPHTQVWRDGAWIPIVKELRAKNPLQAFHGRTWALRVRVKNAAAAARRLYFQGLAAEDEAKRREAELHPLLDAICKDLDKLAVDMKVGDQGLAKYEAGQAMFAQKYVDEASTRVRPLVDAIAKAVSAEAIKDLAAAQVLLEKAAETFDAEPPPRALSPIAYDAKTKVFVVFGGDHFDYLTNDLWVFDPAPMKWMQRHPQSAPPPRANHLLASAGDGAVTVSDGYVYADVVAYMAGQYKDVGDSPWTYNLATNEWTGGTGVPANSRAYRTGAFHPDYFLQSAKPSAAENEARLKALPANAWVDMKPPQRPVLNRDWGTAILDPDHDLILRWSGGHCAHGGTDVPQYHLATNRWELPFPTEFMLGFMYSGTDYPVGYNFNLRPWMPGHTYHAYGYDHTAKRMVHVGGYRHGTQFQDANVYYLYDPAVGDWVGRGTKPPALSQGVCCHVLVPCDTPKGLLCWNQDGQIFRFDPEKPVWTEAKLTGAKLPGTSVDSSLMVYDSKRDRLLCATAVYTREFAGEMYAVDLTTFEVKALAPAGKAGLVAAMKVKHYLREADYDGANDLVLITTPLAEADRTPAYDCAGNRWVSVKTSGAAPVMKDYISLGLSYDAKRNLHWAIGQWNEVRVLRLDAKTADVAPFRSTP